MEGKNTFHNKGIVIFLSSKNSLAWGFDFVDVGRGRRLVRHVTGILSLLFSSSDLMNQKTHETPWHEHTPPPPPSFSFYLRVVNSRIKSAKKKKEKEHESRCIILVLSALALLYKRPPTPSLLLPPKPDWRYAEIGKKKRVVVVERRSFIPPPPPPPSRIKMTPDHYLLNFPETGNSSPAFVSLSNATFFTKQKSYTECLIF